MISWIGKLIFVTVNYFFLGEAFLPWLSFWLDLGESFVWIGATGSGNVSVVCPLPDELDDGSELTFESVDTISKVDKSDDLQVESECASGDGLGLLDLFGSESFDVDGLVFMSLFFDLDARIQKINR